MNIYTVTRLSPHYAHSVGIQLTDDDDKLPGSYPYRKYMVCVVLNIIQWTLSGDGTHVGQKTAPKQGPMDCWKAE